MYACMLETERGFFQGACAPSNATAHSYDQPHNTKEPEPWQWGSGPKWIMRRLTVGGALAWGRGNHHSPSPRAPLACHPRAALNIEHAPLKASQAATLLVGTRSRSSHDLTP